MDFSNEQQFYYPQGYDAAYDHGMPQYYDQPAMAYPDGYQPTETYQELQPLQPQPPYEGVQPTDGKEHQTFQQLEPAQPQQRHETFQPMDVKEHQTFQELQPVQPQPLYEVMQPLFNAPMPLPPTPYDPYSFGVKHEPASPPPIAVAYSSPFDYDDAENQNPEATSSSSYINDNEENVQVEQKPAVRQTRGRKRKQAEVRDEGVKKMARLRPSTPSTSTDDSDVPAIAPEKETFFQTVHGRLCVIGAQKDYDVTTQEIMRRASKPEGLVKSHIGPLLKRGKVKGTGDELVKLLEQHAINVREQTVNRKQYPMTTLTALLEGEALQLSADHKEIALANLPIVPLARLIIRQIDSPAALSAAVDEAHAACQAMTSLLSILNQWTAGGWKEGRQAILSSPLKNFALATHTLGVEECLLIANIFLGFLRTLKVELEAHFETVNRAAGGFAANLMQFPQGVQPPSIPAGALQQPDFNEESRGAESFTQIPGRLTLQNKKYEVTVAEVMRRVREPEHFNLSILGSFLKKGKTKDNCGMLRDELAKHGVELKPNKRKMARNSTFTPMLEGEALDLAKDIEAEAKRTFPDEQIVDELVNQQSEEKQGFTAASHLASSLSEILFSLRLPVAQRVPTEINEDAHLMFDYCNLTHGYGPDAVVSWLGVFRHLFDKTAEKMSEM